MVYLGNVSSLMLSGPSNPHRHGHLPKILLGTVFGSCQVFSGEKKPLKNCLRTLGDICQLLGKVQLGGAGPAEKQQGQAASGSFALIFHLVTLHLSLMNVIFEKHGLAKGRLRSVNGEFKACI